MFKALKRLEARQKAIERYFPDSGVGESPIARAIAADKEPDYPWLDRISRHFTPLPLNDFVESDQHISASGQVRLYPKQREDLERFLGSDPKQVFEGDRLRSYTEAFLVWGKGSGKDFVVSVTQAWVVHILLCLKSPQAYLGMAPNENIDLAVIGYGEYQAKTVYFQKFRNRIINWPWLRTTLDLLRPDVGGDRWLKDRGDFVHAQDIEFPHHIHCWSLTSSVNASEGKNLLFWVLDELAAFSGSESKANTAKMIHSLVVSSARTRFNNRWRGFAISFPRHAEDYMMQMVALSRRSLLKDTYSAVRATWEVVPHLTEDDFAEDYRRNPEESDTKYACRPPAAIDAYFRSPELLLMHSHGIDADLIDEKLPDLGVGVRDAIAARGRNPISMVDRFGDPVLDDRGFPQLADWFRSEKSPSGLDYDYYCHLDPGLTGDGYGLAIGHLHQPEAGQFQPQIDLAFRWTGAMFEKFGDIRRESYYERDNAHTDEVTAKEVDYKTVRYFLYYLSEVRGFHFAWVSADRWNSADSIQELRNHDFNVMPHLVTKEDYDEFKSLVYDRQLIYYGYRALILECYKLILTGGAKVDAPRSESDGMLSNSHKDVSDAVAAVVWAMVRAKDPDIVFSQFEEIEDDKKPQPIVAEVGGERMLGDSRTASLLSEFFD